MRLLRLNGVEKDKDDRVFRHSRTHAVVAALIAISGATWFAFHAYTAQWKLGYFIAAAIVLFLDLFRLL